MTSLDLHCWPFFLSFFLSWSSVLVTLCSAKSKQTKNLQIVQVVVSVLEMKNSVDPTLVIFTWIP